MFLKFKQRSIFFCHCRLEGARGFYKGLWPSLVRVVPACSITFVVYENMIAVLLPAAQGNGNGGSNRNNEAAQATVVEQGENK